MTHKTRKTVKFRTVLRYLTNLHHELVRRRNSVKMCSGKMSNLVKVRSTA